MWLVRSANDENGRGSCPNRLRLLNRRAARHHMERLVRPPGAGHQWGVRQPTRLRHLSQAGGDDKHGWRRIESTWRRAPRNPTTPARSALTDESTRAPLSTPACRGEGRDEHGPRGTWRRVGCILSHTRRSWAPGRPVWLVRLAPAGTSERSNVCLTVVGRPPNQQPTRRRRCR